MKHLLVCLLVIAACSGKPQTGESPTASTAPTPPAPAGPPSASRVVTEHFHSDALGVDKAVVVYLPRGYDSAPARHWPVF
jgi:hypothetical protein